MKVETGQNSRKFEIDQNNVKWIGRTLFQDGVLWCGPSGSGAAFRAKAKRLAIWLAGDDTTAGNITEGPARVGIFVNGKRTVDMVVTNPCCRVEIWEGDSIRTAEVVVLKLSECAMSVAGIAAVETEEGAMVTPKEPKLRRIEFVGDSITCGFGVDLEKPDTEFETKTEDFTKTYAYKTAQLLCADYSVVAYSGYGVLSGFTDNGMKNTFGVLPPLYDKVGFSFGHPEGMYKLEEAEWDFGRFVPQVIVMNLGTNDTCYCGTDPDKQEEFKGAYVDFLKKVRSYNPSACILGVVGTMGTILCSAVTEAVERYGKETGDQRVWAMALPEQLPQDGLVTGNHPTERTHEKTAELIVEKIRQMTGWQA